MKNSLRRFKIRLFLELSLQIVGAILLLFLGLRLVDGILNDFIANFLFSLDSGLYRFCVRNKEALLFLIGSGTIMIVIYFTIRKTSNYLEQIITSINQVFNKDEGLVVLPTDFKEIENQLNSIKYETLRSEQAQQQEQQKRDDLVVYLAHDLKTPLTSIIGYLSLLNDEKEISEELREKYTQIALEKSYRLESLINEFFDITRFALQKQTLNKEPVNLSVMLQQLTDEFYPLFEERQVQCQLQLKEGVMIEADADKLARVFDNLLRNALAYCDSGSDIEIILQENAGGVELMFANIGPQLSAEECTVSFADNGIGIGEEHLPHIFERFYRIDKGRSRKQGGTGLGLAIARDIVELHGGTINAVGHGKRIEFHLHFRTLPKNTGRKAPQDKA